MLIENIVVERNSKLHALVVPDFEAAEATGLTKTLNIGVFGGAATAFILDADCAAAGPVGKVNNLTVQDTSVNNTIGYTFGSGDWAEFKGKVTLTFVVVG